MIWKDVKGYEGLYKVNADGNILSLARRGNWRGTHILIPQNGRDGYQQVILTKNGTPKTRKIHRIVAEAFVPNPRGYKEINHKDEDKKNNNACNLEWCTRTYNVNYGTRLQRMSTRVAMYSPEGEFLASYNSISEARKKNGFRTAGNISNVLKGKAVMAYGYRWKEIKS